MKRPWGGEGKKMLKNMGKIFWAWDCPRRIRGKNKGGKGNTGGGWGPVPLAKPQDARREKGVREKMEGFRRENRWHGHLVKIRGVTG